MPNSVADGKTLPRLSMQVIKKKVLEITRIRPKPPRKVAVERKYFSDSGPGGGIYDFKNPTQITITAATALTVGSSATISVATITDNADLHFSRLQFTPVGSTDPIASGYEHLGKTGGGVHVLKVYDDSGTLKVDVFNNGSVDVNVRVVYYGEVITA